MFEDRQLSSLNVTQLFQPYFANNHSHSPFLTPSSCENFPPLQPTLDHCMSIPPPTSPAQTRQEVWAATGLAGPSPSVAHFQERIRAGRVATCICLLSSRKHSGRVGPFCSPFKLVQRTHLQQLLPDTVRIIQRWLSPLGRQWGCLLGSNSHYLNGSPGISHMPHNNGLCCCFTHRTSR